MAGSRERATVLGAVAGADPWFGPHREGLVRRLHCL